MNFNDNAARAQERGHGTLINAFLETSKFSKYAHHRGRCFLPTRPYTRMDRLVQCAIIRANINAFKLKGFEI